MGKDRWPGGRLVEVAPELIGIVGAGPAGGRAAGSLRERGFEGRLVLLGDELEPPYERPPLSKAYLTGDQSRAADGAPARSEGSVDR